ncbi:response regulator transcription factor [Actinomadura oligospora]|uniref:response regulator transcription factor n=1 Tax=Actinomadura oligospora TaxID=111804 RepID=UPI00047EBF69|nr:response regulator transcription factor [Actinomadura oligospora]
MSAPPSPTEPILARAPTLSTKRTPAAPDRIRSRVLVTEDDDIIGRHLETGLHSNGYAPAWSRIGTSGLAEAARTPDDAVLLDLGPPDMDGLDVARALRPTRRPSGEESAGRRSVGCRCVAVSCGT